MNTAVYYVFLYIYSCLTNDFCSDRIKHDDMFREEVLKIWNLTLAKDPNDLGNDFDLAPRLDGLGSGPTPAPGPDGVHSLEEFLSVPCKELTQEQLDRLKNIFYQIRDQWGSLPADHFDGGIEDKVARMVITLAIFNGSANSISRVKSLLNDKGCTNKKNQIHMDCLADFGTAAVETPEAAPEAVFGAAPGAAPRAAPRLSKEPPVGGFRVDFNRVVNKPGIRVCLIRGHFIPYFVKPNSVFFVDLERVVPEECLGPFRGKEVFFLDYKINQLGEECGLHSMMTILYTKIVDINPYFVWLRKKHHAIDYKSLEKMKTWLDENNIDISPLLRAQEFISYKIF